MSKYIDNKFNEWCKRCRHENCDNICKPAVDFCIAELDNEIKQAEKEIKKLGFDSMDEFIDDYNAKVGCLDKTQIQNERLTKENEKLKSESVYNGILCMSEKGKSETHYLRLIDKLQQQVKEAIKIISGLYKYYMDTDHDTFKEYLKQLKKDTKQWLKNNDSNATPCSNKQEG